ncbi:hypothetical protein [Francisella sp. 19X1-34]|uniref:hypothetical protein n=1 Tax=Francisella sp. 19X1-34 TaxID=3087177 RepID=UPI002E32900D|nr:hypothetical protein [Francisella sp. 19X1-34]MED7788731.1 hypothetical protein [Francisella sp. 19X1-34]
MIYTILFIITTAISAILIHIIGNIMPAMLMIFLSITIALLFFNILNIKKICLTYGSLIKNDKKNFLIINLLMLNMWGGSFLIPIYFTPSILAIPYFLILGFCGTISLFFKKNNKFYLLRAILLFTTLIALYIYYSFCYQISLFIILLVSTLITGISGYLYLKVSSNFNSKSYSSIEILSFRFFIIWIISFLYVLEKQQIFQLSIEMLPMVFLIATISLIIPIYFSQKSIEKIGAVKSGIGFSITPIVITVSEQPFIKVNLDFSIVFAVIFTSIIILSYLYELVIESN